MKKLEKQAIGIVAQLFDLAEVPIDKRQQINDVAYDYVTEQLIITDVGCSKRFSKDDLLKAYQAGALEQKSINTDTFDFKKLKELKHDSVEWYERYTE